MDRVNKLSDKLNRESENYHDRVNAFNKKIGDLEAEIKYKQNTIDKNSA